MIVRTYGRRSSRGSIPESTSFYSGGADVGVEDDNDDDPFAFNEVDPTPPSSSYYTNFSNKNNNTTTSFSQETLEFQENYNFAYSSQDSTRFLDNSESPSSPGSSLQLIKPRKKARKLNDGRRKERKVIYEEEEEIVGTGTATLMETQEGGEMMECVDEVEFAVDGLRKGEGIRVRRGSLLALLNVCSNLHHCRLLKAQGMAKTIVDAVLEISLDDSASNLAAATLFYILTNDGQDSYLLDSPRAIRFLLRLLKPVVVETAAVKSKRPSFSQKLLALRNDMLVSQDSSRTLDSSSTDIVHKVMEILVRCKDLKTRSLGSDDMSRPELNPDWVSLLTIEKACLSTVSIQDTRGTMMKTGGNFKEKLRDLGGLDAIFELTLKFRSTLEALFERVSPSISESKEGKLQCLPLLLKCLKIMENATFLSKENQSHLLGLKGNLNGQGSSLSFVELMVNFIKILSDLSLQSFPSATSSPEVPAIHSNGADHSLDLLLDTEQKVASNGILSSWLSQECNNTGRYSSSSGLSVSQVSQRTSAVESKALPPKSEATTSWVGNCLIDLVSSSGSGSCSLTSKSSGAGLHLNGHDTHTNIAPSKRPYDNDNDMVIDLDDSQDPFAFDEDDYAPSKWDKVSGPHKGRRKQKGRAVHRDVDYISLSHLMLSQEDSFSQPMFSQENSASQPILCQEDRASQSKMRKEGLENGVENGNSQLSSDTSCTTTIDEESSSLVTDCLLTAIKVLMNLTNDNAIGCKQIAACSGMETLSFLIARHFPSFSLTSSGARKDNLLLADSNPSVGSQTDLHFSDHDLDLLVTILGLLVNMVENDGDNRLRLAASKVSFPSACGLKEVHTGVIPLLCSIFLANRGAGEAAEEELQSWDDEDAVLQGEKEAEKMIVEAYAALLLAFLSTESKSIRNTIAQRLPDHNLKVLVPVLDRFVTFHTTLNMISPETHKTVSEVIESCRLP